MIACPLCGEPLQRADRPTRIMNGQAQRLYVCTCHGGVESWVMKSAADGQLFVARFKAKEPISARNTGTQS